MTHEQLLAAQVERLRRASDLRELERLAAKYNFYLHVEQAK